MSGSGHFLSDIGKRVSINRHYYSIEKVIAEGGYGVVFLVRDGHGRRLALKRLYVNDEARLKECRSEVDILRKVSGYKNVIKYLDSAVNHLNNGVTEVLILTEYYPVTCTQLQEEKKIFSESEVMRIFCDMCEALSVLHHCQTAITHRDMKVENILLDRHHNYVLCDFGSATTQSYERGKHNMSVRQMEEEFNKHTTPSHRSPEIVDFYSNQNITTKLDIWALGVTLYRLCFNQLPFGESILAIQSGHITIPDSSTYSDSIHALIYYCLEVDPDKRPDIYQVASVAFQITGRQCAINTNINNSTVVSSAQLIELMKRKREHASTARAPSPRVPDQSEWVETTTVRPRERPKAGKHLQPPQSHPHHAPTVALTATQNTSQSAMQSLPPGSAVPVANMLDFGSALPTMTRSLDASSHRASPFGDDFSQFDAGMFSVGASSTPAALNSYPAHHNNNASSINTTSYTAGRPAINPASTNTNTAPNAAPNTAPSTDLLGFEDSFADLLISSSAIPPNTIRSVVAESRLGHRRYKSDGAHVLTQSRPPISPHAGRSAMTPNPPSVTTTRPGALDFGFQVNDGRGMNVPTQKQKSPFGDDFSSYNPSDITAINQSKPLGVPASHNTPVRHELDPFGSTPFNQVPFIPAGHTNHKDETHSSMNFDNFSGGGSISCRQ